MENLLLLLHVYVHAETLSFLFYQSIFFDSQLSMLYFYVFLVHLHKEGCSMASELFGFGNQFFIHAIICTIF